MFRRFGVVCAATLLCTACGGTLSAQPDDAAVDASADVMHESGSICAPPPTCANAGIVVAPIPLKTLADHPQSVFSVVTTDCGYALITQGPEGVVALPFSRKGDHFVVGTPYSIESGFGQILWASALHDMLLFTADAAHTHHFFGPALGTASFDVAVAADMGLAGYAAHGDRLLFLFEEQPQNNTTTLYSMEATRNGTVTQALAPTPDGTAIGLNGFSPGLVSYIDGFAWFVPRLDGSGTIFFSPSPGVVSEFAAPPIVDNFLPLTPWPYGAGVALNGSPSMVVLDNGQAGPALTRHASAWYSSNSSPELGIIDASRWTFSQVDANGNATQVSYDGGPEENVESFQPAPALAIRGGEAVLVNADGNVIAVGCTP